MSSTTPEMHRAQTRLRNVAAGLIQLYGSEATAGIFLQLTTALLALDKDTPALAQFLRDLATEVEACERPIEPFNLN